MCDVVRIQMADANRRTDAMTSVPRPKHTIGNVRRILSLSRSGGGLASDLKLNCGKCSFSSMGIFDNRGPRRREGAAHGPVSGCPHLPSRQGFRACSVAAPETSFVRSQAQMLLSGYDPRICD